MNDDVRRERDHWNDTVENDETMRAAVGGSPAVEDWEDVDDELGQIEAALGVSPDGRYAELGCGPGRLLAPLARLNPGASWWGLDVAGALLQRLPRLPNLTAIANDGRTIPLDDATLDGVFCVTVFQHLPDDAVIGYLREIGRVLRDGGKALVQYVRDEDAPMRPRREPAPFLHNRFSDVAMVSTARGAGLDPVDIVPDPRQDYRWTWLELERTVR